MCGALSLIEKCVDQALGIFGLEGDDAGKLALVVRIVRVEAFSDELGMVVVLGEDDGLAQPVAACDLLAVGHQVLKHLVDRVRVEQPLVDRCGFDLVRDRAVLVPFQRVPLLLFFIGLGRRI